MACRVLVHYRFDSVQGADAHLTQVLVLKLHREYSDSAFAVWAQHKVPDVASLLGGLRAVEAAAAAVTAAGSSEAAAAGLGLSCEAAKAVLQEVLAARKQVGLLMCMMAQWGSLECMHSNCAVVYRHGKPKGPLQESGAE